MGTDGVLQAKETIVWRFGSDSGRHGIDRYFVTREPYAPPPGRGLHRRRRVGHQPGLRGGHPVQREHLRDRRRSRRAAADPDRRSRRDHQLTDRDVRDHVLREGRHAHLQRLRRVLLGRHRLGLEGADDRRVGQGHRARGGAGAELLRRTGPERPSLHVREHLRRGGRVHPEQPARRPGPDHRRQDQAGSDHRQRAAPGAGREQAEREREGRTDRVGRSGGGFRGRFGDRRHSMVAQERARPALCRAAARHGAAAGAAGSGGAERPGPAHPGGLHPTADPGGRGGVAGRRTGGHPRDRGDHHRSGREGCADRAEHRQEGLPGDPGRSQTGRRRRTRWCC